MASHAYRDAASQSCCYTPYVMTPARIASTIASRRDETSKARYMAMSSIRTVEWLYPIRIAIWSYVMPWASSCKTVFWRSVKSLKFKVARRVRARSAVTEPRKPHRRYL